MSGESAGKISLDLELEGNLTRQITVMANEIGHQLSVTIERAVKSINLEKLNKHVKGRLAETHGPARTTRVAEPKTPNQKVNIEALKAEIDNTAKSLDITNAKIDQQKKKLVELKEAYEGALKDNRKNKIAEEMLKTEAAINKLMAVSDKTGFKLASLDKHLASIENGLYETNDTLRETSRVTKNVGKEIDNTGKQAVKSTKKVNNLAGALNRSFMTVLRRMFVYNLIFRTIRGLTRYLGSAMRTNTEFAKSLAQVRTNLQVAFMPIYQYILPAINALMRSLARATTYLATFVSAIFGKTYQQSFKAAQGLNRAKQEMEGLGKAAKNMKGALAGFDEVNTLNNDDADTGIDIPELAMPPIDVSPASAITKAIENVVATSKRLLGSIFQPFRNAWDNHGVSVMDEFARFRKTTKGLGKDIAGNLVYIWDNGGAYLIENIAKLGLSFTRLALVIYNDFVSPIVGWFVRLISPAIALVLKGVGWLLEKFNDLISWLLGDGRPVLDTFIIILGSFALAWVIVASSLKIATVATKVWGVVAGIGKIKTLGFAGALSALFSPVTIAVLAIGALIAIGILLYKNWDVLKTKATDVWDSVKIKFEVFKNWLGDVFATDWSEKFGLLGNILNGFLHNVSSIFKGVRQIFRGIIDFVTGVFTGDWEKAWTAVKDIFGGIFNTFAALVKMPMNAVISLINGAISGLNKINVTIPSWVPGMGGKSFGFSIPKVPMLARGGIVDQPTLAMVGERGKEAVVPLENTAFVDTLASALGNAVMTAMQMSGQSSQSEGGDVVIEIDGTTFARIMNPFLRKEDNRVGTPLLKPL